MSLPAEEMIRDLLAEIEAIDQKATLRMDDLRRADEILDRVTEMRREQDREAMRGQLEQLGVPSNTAGGPEPSLGAAIEAAGFHRVNRPSVMVDVASALGVEAKAATVNGNLEDALNERVGSTGLGLDSRYLFPSLSTRFVDADTAGITSFKQATRILADPSTMVRTIAATSEKPESDLTAVPISAPLKQIASTSQGIPNILLESDEVRRWIDQDLTAAWRAALDFHVISEIGLEVTNAASGGSNLHERIAYASEEVRGNGYSPNVVALSTKDALSLQLLQLTGGTSYIFEQSMPRVIASPAIADDSGIVFDTSTLGTLYLSPFRIAAFEESSGQTNTSTVRGESNGLFLVQRADAACYLDEQGS